MQADIISLLDKVNDTIISFNIDGKIGYVNQAFANIVGLEPCQLINMNIWELRPRLVGTAVQEGVQEAIERKELKIIEWQSPYSENFWETKIFPLENGVIAVGRDITSRVKSEEGIKKTKEQAELVKKRLETILELTPSAVVILDAPNGKFSYANKRAMQLYGFNTLGLDFAQNVAKVKARRVDGKEYPIEEMPVSRTLKFGKEIRNEELLIERADGKPFPIIVSTAPLRNKQGHIIAAIAVFEDITDRKKIEEALKDSEQLYRTLFENSEDGFLLLEPVFINGTACDFRFLKLNRSYEHQMGTKADDVLGKLVSEVTPELEHEITLISSDVVKTGKPVHHEAFNKFSDKWYDSYYIPYAKGQVGILFRDITNRKKTEEALKESEERLKTYLESSPAAIFVSKSNGKFVYVNQAATRLLGYSKEEFLKMNVFDTTFEDELNFNIKRLEALKKDCSAFGEMRFRRKDGEPVFAILNATVLPDGNMIATCEDLSERKELEKRLREHERLAAIGQTAGMVGHDIRNPLQAILSDTYLLKDELTSIPECENKEGGVTESIEGIERNVSYINKIVQDLQDYARPVTPEYSIADLSDVFVHVFETINVAESIDFSINVKDSEKIRIDPTLLQRAITNIVNNALQAMPEGGKLEIYGEKKDNRIIITISDTGVGIPDDIKSKIFAPMMTTKAKGQGFGLAVTKRIIEAMKGTISFESKEGKGTKFIIKLPTD